MQPRQYRSLAIALWAAPPIIGWPLWRDAFRDPSTIIQSWDVWLIFVGLPFAAGAILWRRT